MTKLKDGWYLIYKEYSFSIMYNIVDGRDIDKSDVELEYRKDYYVVLVTKLWPHVIKDITECPTGIVMVLRGIMFNTIEECKFWAEAQWENRKNESWYEEFVACIRNNLKEDILNSKRLKVEL